MLPQALPEFYNDIQKVESLYSISIYQMSDKMHQCYQKLILSWREFADAHVNDKFNIILLLQKEHTHFLPIGEDL